MLNLWKYIDPLKDSHRLLGLRDSPMVKNTYSSSWVPNFGSQHPLWVAHNCLWHQLLGFQCLWFLQASALMYTYLNTDRQTDTHTHTHIIKNNKEYISLKIPTDPLTMNTLLVSSSNKGNHTRVTNFISLQVTLKTVFKFCWDTWIVLFITLPSN